MLVHHSDSTGASTWVTDGSSVSLDVWSSKGGSEVSCHIHHEEADHQVDIERVNILAVELRWFEQGVREAIYIRMERPSLNKEGLVIVIVKSNNSNSNSDNSNGNYNSNSNSDNNRISNSNINSNTNSDKIS